MKKHDATLIRKILVEYFGSEGLFNLNLESERERNCMFAEYVCELLDVPNTATVTIQYRGVPDLVIRSEDVLSSRFVDKAVYHALLPPDKPAETPTVIACEACAKKDAFIIRALGVLSNAAERGEKTRNRIDQFIKQDKDDRLAASFQDKKPLKINEITPSESVGEWRTKVISEKVRVFLKNLEAKLSGETSGRACEHVVNGDLQAEVWRTLALNNVESVIEDIMAFADKMQTSPILYTSQHIAEWLGRLGFSAENGDGVYGYKEYRHSKMLVCVRVPYFLVGEFQIAYGKDKVVLTRTTGWPATRDAVLKIMVNRQEARHEA